MWRRVPHEEVGPARLSSLRSPTLGNLSKDKGVSGPDLTSATAIVESLMEDACTIDHDPQGFADDLFDRATGAWTRPAADATQVYSGKCYLSRSSSGIGSDRDDASRPKSQNRLVLKVPVGTSCPAGAVVTVTASKRNSMLVGTTWRVIAENSSSLAVTQRALIERLVDSLVEQADQ